MEKKQNVPALRFPGFSGEWKSHQLQSFGKATGGTPIESEFVSQGKYKVISIGSYSEQGTYIDQGIRANYSEKTAKRILNKDDLAMLLNDKTLRGNIIGRVLLIDADDSYVYNQRTERLEVDKDNFNPSFLHCLFNVDKIRKAIIYNAVGITQIHVNWSAISQLFYHIPPTMAEQNCISNFNIEYSQFILLQKNKIRKLQQFRQAMLAKLFPREGAAEPELRFRGFSGKWRIRTLAKCAALHARIGWQNLRKSEFLTKGDYYLITGTDFVDGQIEWRTCHYVSKLRYDQDKNIQVQNGDILVTKDGTLGKVAYVDGADKPATLNAGVFNVKINVNDVDAKYLYQYLKGPYLMDYVNQRATGGTIKHLNQNILVDFPVVMPSFEEQKIIGDFFYRLDRYISLQQKKLERMQRLKAALLEKLFV